MDPTTAAAWLDLLRSLGFGFTVAAVLFVWGLYKGKIVWGWYCQGVEREREEWKRAALSGTGVLEKLVDRIESRRV